MQFNSYIYNHTAQNGTKSLRKKMKILFLTAYKTGYK